MCWDRLRVNKDDQGDFVVQLRFVFAPARRADGRAIRAEMQSQPLQRTPGAGS